MVDQLHLFLLPFFPAILTDLTANAFAQLGRYRRKADRLALLPAPRAFEFVVAK
jgi:hypothetical protein